MKEIPLTKNMIAVVDDADFDALSKYQWRATKGGNSWYAEAKINGVYRRMHRMIMGLDAELDIDHRNGNGLDNRRDNLRFATDSQNQANAGIRIDSSSGYKGVQWDRLRRQWRARITYGKRRFHVGWFGDKEQAAKAYDIKARELFGEFARLNFP